MKKWHQKLLYCNFGPDTDRGLLNKILLFNIIVGVYTLTAVPFSMMHILKGKYVLATILMAGVAVIIVTRIFLCATRKHGPAFAVTTLMVIFVFLSNYITGGTNNYGPLWYYTFPMMGLIFLGPLYGSIASLCLAGISILLLMQPFSRVMMTTYDPKFLMRFMITYMIVYVFAFAYEYQRQRAGREIKELKGLLPICASCKRIRDDKGYWNQIETYIGKHSEAEFSHSICPACTKELYPEYEKLED